MRRISLWVLSTLSCMVLLFGYRTSTSGALGSSTPPGVTSGATSGNGSSSTSSTGSGSGSGSTGSSGTRTVTGAVAQTQWGPVQVQLTVTSGRITAVKVLEQPDGNPRDTEINDYALPILTHETVDAQNASIDMVSGATVTSDGYVESLQSALDEANL